MENLEGAERLEGFPQAFHALEMKFFFFRFRPEGPTFFCLMCDV